MTAFDIGESRPAGLIWRIREWRARRKQRRTRPDITKLVDGLNAHLLRDMGYRYETAGGLRKRKSAELWMGRTPPGWHDI